MELQLPEIAEEYGAEFINLSALYLPKVVLAIITLVIGFWFVGHLNKIVHKALRYREVDASLVSFLESLISITLKVLVVVSVASMVGIQTTSFIAVLGAASLAVGLSLQGSLSNFAGGVLILLFKPFKVGDVIEAEGFKGKVTKIQITNTVLKQPNNTTIIIPNGNLSNGVIQNFSKEPNRRIDLVFGISYCSDIEKAKQVLKDVIAKDEKALKDPEALVAVSNLGASSVDLGCWVWVKKEDFIMTSLRLQEAVKLAFDANDISMPFPQREIRIVNES